MAVVYAIITGKQFQLVSSEEFLEKLKVEEQKPSRKIFIRAANTHARVWNHKGYIEFYKTQVESLMKVFKELKRLKDREEGI